VRGLSAGIGKKGVFNRWEELIERGKKKQSPLHYTLSRVRKREEETIKGKDICINKKILGY